MPGADIVFEVAGAHPRAETATTDANGSAGISYTAAADGDDTITACLDANANGACEPARSPTPRSGPGRAPAARGSAAAAD